MGSRDPQFPRTLRERARGCLLGGAVGDALGAPVEFMDEPAIRRKYGSKGIVEFDEAYDRLGAITDDTQMTLFTAEGLIRARVRAASKGICNVAFVVGHAYQRWLRTQDMTSRIEDVGLDGWLVGVKALWSRRAPGRTCLGALADTTAFGKPADNDSKGCGGVMRVAPVGLVADDAFQLGCEVARLTHGHPSGYLAAGYFAATIAGLAAGQDLPGAMSRADAALADSEPVRHGLRGADETSQAVARARRAAANGRSHRSIPPELGAGWVAEEALAIALYCALVADDFERAVVLAVNHGGDSDSTGSIAGQIMGATLGESAIPRRWLEAVELGDVIARVADDLTSTPDQTSPDWQDLLNRYPGW